jgi:hypothetical protein
LCDSAEAGFLLAQQHKYMTMPIEITPGITITAGLTFESGNAPIQTATLLITEAGLDLQTEVGDDLTTE